MEEEDEDIITSFLRPISQQEVTFQEKYPKANGSVDFSLSLISNSHSIQKNDFVPHQYDTGIRNGMTIHQQRQLQKQKCCSKKCYQLKGVSLFSIIFQCMLIIMASRAITSASFDCKNNTWSIYDERITSLPFGTVMSDTICADVFNLYRVEANTTGTVAIHTSFNPIALPIAVEIPHFQAIVFHPTETESRIGKSTYYHRGILCR
eukprot:gene7700-9907_t